jgi:hypothetical protein
MVLYGPLRTELLRRISNMEEYVGFTHAMNFVCSHFAPDISLSELQKTLDAQGIEVVENQKESVVGRKALADKTKGKGCLPPLHKACS